MKQSIVTLDFEGVLVPEIWIAVADKTGVRELRRTARDEPDFDRLMRRRLEILAEHRLKLSDIQQVISTLGPLAGAMIERVLVIMVHVFYTQLGNGVCLSGLRETALRLITPTKQTDSCRH